MKTKQKQKNIPSDWQRAKLGDVCKVNQGLQIPISERFSTSKSNGKLYITTQFLNGKSEAEYICDYTDSVVCKKEDILMTRTGNSGIVVTGVEGVFHNNFFKVRPNKNVNSKLLIYNLVSPYIQYKLLKLAGASTIPDLNHGDFYSIDLLLPPLLEQNRIVAVLETWDSGIEKLKKKIAIKKEIKKGLMQELLTGKKRLPGFSDEWKNYEMCQMLDYEQPTSYLVSSTDYSNEFKTPVLTAGKTFLLGYTDEKDGLYDKGPVIIFDDFTTANKYVDFEFKVKSSAMKMLTEKEGFNLEYLFERMQLLNLPSGEHKRRYLSEYQYLACKIPSKTEQDAVTEIISSSKKEITTLEEKLTLWQEQKKYLLNNLVTGQIRTPKDLKL